MASVINSTTLQFLESVNTPDFPTASGWVINPDMSQVVGVAHHYWKWDAGTTRPIPMTAGEQAAVNTAEAATAATALENIQTQNFPGLSKGDMAVFNGTKVKRMAVGADDESLVADSSTALGVKWAKRLVPVVKPSNEVRTATTTLADDAALTFAVVANGVYVFRAVVFFESPAAADFKCTTAGPASPTNVRIMRQAIAEGATAMSNVGVSTAFGTVLSITGTGTSGGYVEFNGVLDNGANAGTVSFQWAQDTSNAGNTVVAKASYIEHARIS